MLPQGPSLLGVEIEEEKQESGRDASSWAILFGQKIVAVRGGYKTYRLMKKHLEKIEDEEGINEAEHV